MDIPVDGQIFLILLVFHSYTIVPVSDMDLVKSGNLRTMFLCLALFFHQFHKRIILPSLCARFKNGIDRFRIILQFIIEILIARFFSFEFIIQPITLIPFVPNLDIIDSGRTLAYLIEVLKQRGPKSIHLCTLLDKPERRVKKQVKVDYTCFTIPDEFVVGYGLDYAQKYRNLPYIGVVEVDQ